MVAGLLIAAMGGVFAYAAWRYFRGDWSSRTVEPSWEDSAYDDEDDDFDDADVGDVDDDDDDDEEDD